MNLKQSKIAKKTTLVLRCSPMSCNCLVHLMVLTLVGYYHGLDSRYSNPSCGSILSLYSQLQKLQRNLLISSITDSRMWMCIKPVLSSTLPLEDPTQYRSEWQSAYLLSISLRLKSNLERHTHPKFNPNELLQTHSLLDVHDSRWSHWWASWSTAGISVTWGCTRHDPGDSWVRTLGSLGWTWVRTSVLLWAKFLYFRCLKTFQMSGIEML